MNTYLVLLHPLESARAAAYRVLTSHLAALPVVGEAGRFLGVVTIDAALAQVAPQSWRGQARRVFSGVTRRCPMAWNPSTPWHGEPCRPRRGRCGRASASLSGGGVSTCAGCAGPQRGV